MFKIDFLTDIYFAEQRIKIQTKECEQCQCFSCLNLEKHKNCQERCFKRCKNKRHIWTKCKHYTSI